MSSGSDSVSWLKRAQHWLTPILSKTRTVVFAESHCGPRDENQDNYLIIHPSGALNCLYDETLHVSTKTEWPPGWYRLAVADGMGGHANARQISTRLITELQDQPVLTDVSAMRDAIYTIHQRLYEEFGAGSGQSSSPGSTLIWVDVHVSGLVMVANVGDSRLYHAPQGGSWRPLTYDHHSPEFEWRDSSTAGTDQESELVRHNTNRLAQAIGLGSYGLICDETGYRPKRFNPAIRLDLANDLAPEKSHHADVFSFQLQKGDSLLLASDGLWSEAEQVDLEFPTAAELHDKTDFSKAVWDRLSKAQDNATAVLLTQNK